ncbi:MAG: phosphoglucosamine mutase [candidate division Zixibacteria bacterium]|nr:phosphoglucosamine mutase [candidate division Zixibacteria bacterium]MDH3936152.1 phosphoglucosamine mutase [candidate division Zixibacteria bacterium]MDH4033793.1 phosphoglucosamine mutase [candidate division Zixibacteria bacterium]
MPKQTLIKSTSGIRGIVGAGLDPELVVKYGAAFGTMLRTGTVVVGRDSRPSGEIFMRAVTSGLTSVGINVVETGIVPTPTVEIAVKKLKASGGICVTASHNPAPWNALKFFNDRGEFITPAQYNKLDKILTVGKFAYKPAARLGRISTQTEWIDQHIKMTLASKAVNRAAVRKRKFKIVIDAINGAGSRAIPKLLRELGLKVIEINCREDGNFVHEPEPTPANLGQLGRAVKKHRADLGMACDPDADRLALVDERGRPIGEELTLTIAVQQVLSKLHGPTVINLSTSKVTADAATAMGSKVHYSKVGEANVVQMMHRRKGVIGGEGNGGVIFPSFHAGRDALIAAALVLSRLAEQKITLSGLVETLPTYYTIKSKAKLPIDFKQRLSRFEKNTASRLLGRSRLDRRDGLRFDFDRGWLQIRSSNTEPIFRLIVETDEAELSRSLSRSVIGLFK